jgi:LssY C-terminus
MRGGWVLRAGLGALVLLLFAGVGQGGPTNLIAAGHAPPGTGQAAATQEGKTSQISLPAGTVFYARLETAVSTTQSRLYAPVTAQVVRPVVASQGVAVPLGAVLRGRIEKLMPSSSPTQRARLLLEFTRLEIPGEPPLRFAGRVVEVENARESVLADGMIQGVLASELPLSLIAKAAGKIASGQQTQESILGKVNTAMDYPAGTDLRLELTQPLEVPKIFAPPVPQQLAAGDLAMVARLLAGAPQRVSGKDGKSGDPLNVVFIGSQEEVLQAFSKAGWVEPARSSGQSVWQAARAIIGDVGDVKAPVSDLFLFGRREDLAFAKMLNTVAKRHHLRLWRSGAKTPGGQEVWLGAGTHDMGYDIHPGVVSHAINPDLDAERSKVGADLVFAGCVRREQLVRRPDPLSQGLTATGASWKTDGRLLALQLKPCGK